MFIHLLLNRINKRIQWRHSDIWVVVYQSSMHRWIWIVMVDKKTQVKRDRERESETLLTCHMCVYLFFVFRKKEIDLVIDEMSDMWSTVAHFWTSSLRWEERSWDVTTCQVSDVSHLLYNSNICVWISSNHWRNIGQRLIFLVSFNQLLLC